jgi:hypothetical protein
MSQPKIKANQIDLDSLNVFIVSGYGSNLTAGSPPTRSIGGGPYTNSTGSPIMVCARVDGVDNTGSGFAVDGTTVSFFGDGGAGTNDITHSVMIPNGSTYQLTGSGTLSSWFEVQ